MINKRVKETRDANDDPIWEPPFPEVQKRSMERLAELGMQAIDAEASSKWATSARMSVDEKDEASQGQGSNGQAWR